MFPNTAFVDQLQSALNRDFLAFLPELIVCGTIVLLLLARLVTPLRRIHSNTVAIAGAAAACGVAIAQWLQADPFPAGRHAMFTGLLVYDPLTIYMRILLLSFVVLLLILTRITGIPDREDAADFNVLILGATLGMMMMASANHLLMAFIAIEMASVPSYVLAGFLKGRRQGSEAALKYVVYGASASGIMLYGISLLAGRFGTGYLPDLAAGFQAAVEAGGFDAVLTAGSLFIIVGLAFKLSAVPFHFWCPDVFEGAAAEVGAFLSVASKGAAFALAIRFLNALAGPETSQSAIMFAGSLGLLLAVIAGITATFGNLAALGQTNLKRLLAYSTIAHAGYMLMALVPLTQAGDSAVLFYLAAYLFTNLGAFACVALLRNRTGSENLADMAGMVQREPAIVVALVICLLSLLGLPPLAGFAAKFQVFAVLYDAGRHASNLPILQYAYFGLLALAAINTVISAGYYLKVLRVMVLDTPDDVEPTGRSSRAGAVFVVFVAGVVIALGILWNPLAEACRQAAG